jgi:hypothetical protein
MGKALTLKQVEVIGLSLGEIWNGERVNTVLRSLFERCGWPSHVVSDCGSDIKKGIVDTLLEAPNRASWISDVSHFVANALKHYYAKLSLFQQFQSLCTRIRHRLQQTRFAFLLPPKARAKGRFLSVSRQAEWGLQTLAYLEVKERERSPEATDLAQALRGLKPFKMFLTTFVRNTTCLNEVMKIVKTQGLSTESIQACQERLSDLPARSPIRKEVSHYLQHYVPVVELSGSPLLGSSDVIESLIGKAKQRLEANGRSELNKSILLIPCMCGELTQDLVAEALTTVRVQDVTAWVSENVGETMQSKRRREFPRSQPQKPGAETAEFRYRIKTFYSLVLGSSFGRFSFPIQVSSSFCLVAIIILFVCLCLYGQPLICQAPFEASQLLPHAFVDSSSEYSTISTGWQAIFRYRQWP